MAGNGALRDCYEAGNAYDRGADGHPLSQDRAIQLYAMGCKTSPTDPSCGALKNEVVSLQLSVARRGDALTVLEAACAAGSLDLCNDLATAYRDAVGTPAQPARALTLFEATCHAPDAGATPEVLEVLASACRAVAGLLRSGTAGVPADEARAESAETRAKALAHRSEAMGAPRPP
jgi:TPR repeat protein